MADQVRVEESLEARILAERPRLVRFCAGLTRDLEAAEDLAQEALLEAWRHAGELRDRDRYLPWLLGIARNVCFRWRRRQRIEVVRARELYHDSGSDSPTPEEVPDQEFDLEIELEHDELARLLDRAMSYLPVAVRTVLVERYLEESSLSELAARLGLSEGAVAMRLQRGKLALKRVLTNELSEEAAAYGLVHPAPEGESYWQETRLWCPLCNRRKLLGLIVPSTGEFAMRCPACYEDYGENHWQCIWPKELRGLRSHKAALNRWFNVANEIYSGALRAGEITCYTCGQMLRLQMRLPDTMHPALRNEPGFHSRCERCDDVSWASFTGLVRCFPESQRFWREHPRMVTLPVREVEAQGTVALVAGFQSARGPGRLEIVSTSDSFKLLEIHELPGE